MIPKNGQIPRKVGRSPASGIPGASIGTLLALSVAVGVAAPSAGQVPSSASLRQVMADRAQLCAAALAIAAAKQGDSFGSAYSDLSGRYTILAMMMAPGSVTAMSVFRRLDRDGMSRSRLRDIAQSCKEQLDRNQLQFSLDTVPGFPANDLLRARLCVAALDAAAAMLDPASQANIIRGIQQVRGSLNAYYLERGRALGIPVRADDSLREPFRSPSTGSTQPTGDEAAACMTAGQQALVTIADPWESAGRDR
ncbi:hypothetical protein sS8_2536 [Methylocaldum marinum]|uniref:Uncharacterized protein n=1 Tax=Methylocaldum marinum TaxID=1432792 RepID=A0A250KS71_9GAMM|nr:hypothetical protein [Methylocaldum marinum]BBA34488.1 hypothetical protein sS8_2536 [Methylocaldum marinum]